MPMLLRSGGLLESAATALRRTVAADPENAAARTRAATGRGVRAVAKERADGWKREQLGAIGI